MSCVDVVRHGGAVHLYSDRTRQAAERTVRTGEQAGVSDALELPYTQWLWTRMDHDLGPAPSVLFIGGGGYTLPTQLLDSRPAAQAVAVEIDPLVTEVVRQHLPWAGAMLERTGYDASVDRDRHAADDGRLGVVHADGRVYINEADHRFDAVVMDAFSSGSVPAHLATLETYERLKATVDGPVYVNLIDVPDGPLARGLHAILNHVYPHVEAMQGPVSDRGRANIVLTAARNPIAPLDGVSEEFAAVRVTPARAFTDDRGWVGHR
jgi:spermidine synthase